jgi:hypothetical protein
MFNNGTVEAHNRCTSLYRLPFSSDILETFAVEFDGIQPDMDDEFNAFVGRYAKGVSTWEEFGECPADGSDGNRTRWVNRYTVFCANTSSGTDSNSTTVPSIGARMCTCTISHLCHY